MRRMKKTIAKKEQLRRLSEAITDVRENPPPILSREVLKAIAKKHWVHWKNLQIAVRLLSEDEGFCKAV